jgi:hypothetical protein
LVRLAGDLLGLGEGAMIAPQVVFVERGQALADGNDARARGVERDRGNLGGVHACGSERVPGGGGQSGHLVGVGLRGVVGIFAAAMQRVRGRSGPDGAFLAVNESDANTESAEIDAGDDGHERSPPENVSLSGNQSTPRRKGASR